MTTNNELLPCPFCGSTEIHIAPDEVGSGGQWVGPVHIVCGGDCTAGQSGDDKESAIAAWNRRQPAMPADAMTAVADRYAHRMAMHLECILLNYSGQFYDEAAQTLGEYRYAMNAIHEAVSPTYMGEPVIARRRIEGES